MPTERGSRRSVTIAAAAIAFLAGAGLAAQTPDPVVSIGTAIADGDSDRVPDRLRSRVRVRGVVTTDVRGTHDSWRYTVIQDSSGAVRIASPDTTVLHDGLRRGAFVEIVGAVTTYLGAEEIAIERLLVLGTRALPLATPVSVADLHGERYASRLVVVTGDLSSRVRLNDRAFHIRDESGEIEVRFPERFFEDSTFARRVEGSRRARIVAVAGQAKDTPPYDAGYRLAPRDPEDVVFLPPSPGRRALVSTAVLLLLGSWAVLLAIVLRRRRERGAHRHALAASEERLRHAQRLEAVGRLAGGIAHDFNNLLTAIDGTARMCLLELPPEHAARNDLEQICHATERATGLTRQLLAFGRRQVLQPQTVRLTDVVDRTVTLIQRLIPENIELVVQCDADTPLVHADPGQLEQVLMNLMVNARDAMSAGGTLCIRVRPAIVATMPANGECDEMIAGGERVAELAVTDSGTGMTPEVRARIFEPFFTTKPHGEGTGLGLATVYGIVRQSRGEVRVHSTPGEGSTFSVFLPATVAAPPATPAHTAHFAPAARLADEHIVIVEDESTVMAVAARILRRSGFLVTELSDPTEALRLFEDSGATVDLLVTDMVMPKMNGSELARRATLCRPALPVLFMSGYTEEENVCDFLLERSAFIEKPFSPERLVEMVETLLGVGAVAA